MENIPKLHRPIAVFDAGIGSYAWAKAIREKFPKQDIIYFADRANFPYALKTKEELKEAIHESIERLAKMGAELVIVTSNAPSVVIVNEIRNQCSVPVMGCLPPIEAGIRASKNNEIANLGVKLLLASPEFRFYIQHVAPNSTVHLLNASELVHLVEEGSFVNQPEETKEKVKKYMDDLCAHYPNVDVCTLSSTHLTWIIDYFQEAAPNIKFINPVQQTIDELGPYLSEGTGAMFACATASVKYPLVGLQLMFDKLGIPVKLTRV